MEFPLQTKHAERIEELRFQRNEEILEETNTFSIHRYDIYIYIIEFFV